MKAKIKAITPGETYPRYVQIAEDNHKYEFWLQSYFVGMYCAIYMDKALMTQTGDHDNKRCVTLLKRDIQRAVKRGAQVEIGEITNVVDISPSTS